MYLLGIFLACIGDVFKVLAVFPVSLGCYLWALLDKYHIMVISIAFEKLCRGFQPSSVSIRVGSIA